MSFKRLELRFHCSFEL